MNTPPTPTEEEMEAVKAIPDRDAMSRRTEAEWEALEDAIMTVYGFNAGHTLTEADIAALALMDRCQRDDNEGATEAYHRGREEGLRERGGDELVSLTKREEAAFLGKMTERAMRAMAEARATSAEAQVESLKAALFEFADFADLIDSETEGFADSDPVALVLVPDAKSPVEMQRVPISAFRQARAALTPTQGDDHAPA